MIRWSTGLLAITALLAGTASVGASPIPVATLLGDFNVITLQNFTFNDGDVQGPVLVGGNYASASVFLNSNLIIPLSVAPPAGDVLGEVNIFGNANITGGVIVGNGIKNSLTLVGGTTGPNMFLNTGAGSVTSGYGFPGINFATDIATPLTNYSNTLAALSIPGSTFNTTTGAFTFSFNSAGVAEITLSGATLASFAGTLSFPAIPAGDLAVVNVTGGYTAPADAFAPDTAVPGVLFNFEGPNAVSLGNWGASLLALDATVTGSDDITGDVVAQNFTTGAEVHVDFPPCPASVCTPSTPMPEPGSLALLGAALGSFGLLRRRRS